MNGLTGWIIGILSVVILGTVVNLLTDGGKMAKYIRSVFAAATVLVIVLPFPGIIKNGIDFNKPFLIDYDIQYDTNYLAYAEKIKLSSLAKGIESQLRSDGIDGAVVTLEGNASKTEIEITLVRINLQNAVIDEKAAHINRNESIESMVAGYLKIDQGQVIVDGG